MNQSIGRVIRSTNVLDATVGDAMPGPRRAAAAPPAVPPPAATIRETVIDRRLTVAEAFAQ
jgi:hypothetical protein